MSDARTLEFAGFSTPPKGVLVLFCEEGRKLGKVARRVLGGAVETFTRAAEAERFTGKPGSALEIVAPAGLPVPKLVVVGVGKASKLVPRDFTKFGGVALGKIPNAAAEATIIAELAGGAFKPEQTADLALGMRLRGYTFDRYKTKRKEDDPPEAKTRITIAVGNVAAAEKAWAPRRVLAEGVVLARDLINEPANVVYPEEFARRCRELRRLGVAVEILDVPAMKKLGMHALLGVGQGSAHESRLVVMRWNGGKKGTPPLAFVGKGVCFDSGGISMKPASGMEDMKGDLAGAAAVVGAMHALAARKARVNVVGAVGLVENMPDGKAQRPGDIVKSMSGQTIEIINTDAEGRLVLADVLWYVAKKHKPKLIVDLATLTGAIIVALGHEHAGLFSNDDRLAANLIRAGEACGEKVWRMPLAPEYDKIMDSKFADVKNAGGRNAGAITAAQFLQRFVADKTPWAHIDIAGTALGSPQTDTNKSWSSGFGVQLLDRLVADYYER
jgi:leucyl aminopeptidase